MVADAAFPSLTAPTWPTRLTRFGLWAIGIGLLLVVIVGPLNRFTGVGFQVALLMLAGGVLVLALGALLTIVGFLVGMSKGARLPKGPAALGIVVALGMLGYLLTWLRAGMGVPPIHEVSTDLDAPPPFVAIAQGRNKLALGEIGWRGLVGVAIAVAIALFHGQLFGVAAFST